jgi:hypothetical protein
MWRGLETRSFQIKGVVETSMDVFVERSEREYVRMFYFTGNPSPMTIEWVMACTGRDGAMVRPQGEGQRQHFHYPVNRWYVHSNIHHWAASCKNQNVVGNVSAITQF